MTVIVDNNLPRSLSRLLKASGIEATHVGDLGLSQATDQTLRERFATESIIFISRDGDFWSSHPPTWGVIWVETEYLWESLPLVLVSPRRETGSGLKLA